MVSQHSTILGVMLLAGALVTHTGARGASPVRGEGLYRNHCLSCHESIAHIRENRRARSLTDIRRWVARWAEELDLGWGADEVEDVTSYLNRTYYRPGDVSLAR